MTYMQNNDLNDAGAEGGAAGGAGPGPGDELMDGLGGETTFMSGEEKKPQVSKGVLAVLGLVLAAGAGYFLYMKQGPQTANAGETKTADTITTFLSDGEQHVQLMKQMLDNTEKVVQRFQTYPEHTQIPLADLRANPFRHGPEKVEAPIVPVTNQKDEEERLARANAARDAVAKLRLQSIINGTTKACLINNKLYKQGQEVEGFVIDEIGSGYIVVRMGENSFKLVMQR